MRLEKLEKLANQNHLDQTLVMQKLAENLNGLAIQIQELSVRLEHDETNLRHNNDRITKNTLDINEMQGLIKSLERKMERLRRMQSAPVEAKVDLQNDSYSEIDYLDFEDHFRGSFETIKKRQEFYLPYFKGRANVLDFGCGRGEFLSLLHENKIKAVGVDTYLEYVLMCQDAGLNAVNEDGLKYLGNQKSLDGLFLAQVVEHLSVSQIIDVATLAYEKLELGSYLVMETPNPTSLAIYYNAFYLDPSHQKPVHPFFLEYLVKKVGFCDVKIVYLADSTTGTTIPELSGNNEFNQAMSEVQRVLFGAQDYALIAKR